MALSNGRGAHRHPPAPTGRAIGVDVGGSGIKGAPVDLDRGELAAERTRIPTPQPSTPDAVVSVIARIVEACSGRRRLHVQKWVAALARRMRLRSALRHRRHVVMGM